MNKLASESPQKIPRKKLLFGRMSHIYLCRCFARSGVQKITSSILSAAVEKRTNSKRCKTARSERPASGFELSSRALDSELEIA